MIVIWQGNSGLCNRLFLTAYGIALSEATGQKLVNIHLDHFENLFPGTRPRLGLAPLRYRAYHAMRFFLRALKRMPYAKRFYSTFSDDGKNSAYFSPTSEKFISEVRSRPVTFIHGWPYLEKLNFPNTDLIRHKLAPSSSVLEDANAHSTRARQGADVLVGIHMRGGDYRTFWNGRYFYEMSQYRSLMHGMAQLLAPKRVAFLVCSNEPQQVEDYLPLTVTLGPGTLLGDLFTLSACDYILGPPSTYSLWAAFHGRKPICLLFRPTAPDNLSSFSIPDGNFEIYRTEIN
jgi:Glycosyl transferase family 11